MKSSKRATVLQTKIRTGMRYKKCPAKCFSKKDAFYPISAEKGKEHAREMSSHSLEFRAEVKIIHFRALLERAEVKRPFPACCLQAHIWRERR